MPASQTKLVTTPVGDRPLRVFRATIPISIAVAAAVDHVEIDPAQTALQGIFEPYAFNALAANAPVAAQRSPTGSAILITLDQPLPIKSIRLSGSAPVAANYTLAFHRVDGTVVVEDPTAIAPIQTRLATLSTEFIDGRFAIQLRDATGNPVALSAAHLTEINLQSYPTTPRLGILDEQVTPATLLPVWQAPGEIGRATPSTQGTVNAGDLFATTLQRYLNTHPELLNTPLKLIAESDAPCQFRLHTLTLKPQFVVQRFAMSDSAQSPPPKQVLRFSGKAATTQTLQIPRPPHGYITAATLEVAESLRPQSVTPVTADDGLPTLPTLTTPTGTEGICAQPDRTLAQQVSLPQTTRVNGVALGVMAIAHNTTLHLALFEDREGRPAGKPMAECDLAPIPAGQPTWAIASFSKPVVLFAQPYWMMLSATRGSALWLSQSAEGTVQILDSPAQFQLGQSTNALNALAGLYHWLSPTDTPPANPLQSPEPLSALQVSVDGQTIQGTMLNGKWRYDLTASLNPINASLGAPVADDLISVAFSTASIGSITVYPPRIVFAIATGMT